MLLLGTFNKLQGSSDEVYLKISEKCPDENLLDYVSLVEKPLKKGQKVIPCYVVPDPTTSELMLLIKSKITRDESRRMTNRTFLVKGKNKNTLITKKSILKLEQMREKQRIEQGEKRLVKMRLGFLNVVRQCRVCRGNKIKVLVNIPENKTLHSMVKASFGIDVIIYLIANYMHS